jgi:hypothetical protein
VPCIPAGLLARRFRTQGLRAGSQVFEDFRSVREIGSEDAVDHALAFHARVGDQQIEGNDFLHVDDHGSIDERW